MHNRLNGPGRGCPPRSYDKFDHHDPYADERADFENNHGQGPAPVLFYGTEENANEAEKIDADLSHSRHPDGENLYRSFVGNG